MIGGDDPLPSDDDAAGGEIRAGHVIFNKFVDRNLRPVDDGAARIDDLAEIVAGNVRRHANRDAAGSVDQEIGKPCWQHRRLFAAVIVVGLKVDGILVDVLNQRHRRPGHARLGVPHGRSTVAVHGAEVSLAFNQRQAHHEVLGHAHQGVIDRLIAMGMILSHDISDDASSLAERLVMAVAVLVHRIYDAPLYRLEAIADVGKRPADDHAHGIIEVGALHLLLDGDRLDVRTRR